MFEVGDEVLIKAKVLKAWSKPFEYICEFGNGSCKRTMLFPDNCIMPERTYEQGVTEGRDSAWELAKRFAYGDLSNPDKRRDIFGNTGLFACMNLKGGVEEVLAKIKAWEQKQEIKVKSIVRLKDETEEGIVTAICSTGVVYVMWKDGSCGDFEFSELQNTGKTVEGLEELLRQIGE